MTVSRSDNRSDAEGQPSCIISSRDEINHVLRAYRAEWISLKYVEVFDKYAYGLFNLDDPAYVTKDISSNFSYLTVPSLLVHAFHLIIIYFYNKGKVGGIDQIHFDESEFINKLETGKVKIFKIPELRFNKSINAYSGRTEFSLEMRVRRLLRVHKRVFFFIEITTPARELHCTICGVVE